MVRALLDGRKTQTRRIIKKQPTSVEYWLHGEPSTSDKGIPTLRDETGKGYSMCGPFTFPYGRVGDRLWVKETHAWHSNYNGLRAAKVYEAMGGDVAHCTSYLADDRGDSWAGRARPSIFMPRWASRITLEITNRRVQRLQEISEDDARAEGINCRGCQFKGVASLEYAQLWNQINGPGAWALNPWVWAITFKRLAPRPTT